jgi:hypothetical protein
VQRRAADFSQVGSADAEDDVPDSGDELEGVDLVALVAGGEEAGDDVVAAVAGQVLARALPDDGGVERGVEGLEVAAAEGVQPGDDDFEVVALLGFSLRVR